MAGSSIVSPSGEESTAGVSHRRMSRTIFNMKEMDEALQGSVNVRSVRAIAEVLRKKPFERSEEGLRQVAEAVRGNSFFAKMGHEVTLECCKFMQAEMIGQGHTVIKEGEIGREMFVLFDGTLHILKNGKQVDSIAVNAAVDRPILFGELSLITEMKRNATIRTETRALLGVLTRENYNRFCTGSTSQVQAVVDVLRGMSIFSSMNNPEIFYIACFFKVIRYGRGQEIEREGDKAERLLIISEGRASVLRDGADRSASGRRSCRRAVDNRSGAMRGLRTIDSTAVQRTSKMFDPGYYSDAVTQRISTRQGRSVRLSTLGPGSMFGDVELFRSDAVYNNSLVAAGPCTVLALTKTQAFQVLRPHILKEIERLALARETFRQKRESNAASLPSILQNGDAISPHSPSRVLNMILAKKLYDSSGHSQQIITHRTGKHVSRLLCAHAPVERLPTQVTKREAGRQ